MLSPSRGGGGGGAGDCVHQWYG